MIVKPKNPPICFTCRFYDLWNFDPENPFKCKAYPDGIPKEIITSQADHRKEYWNDQGIQYEKTKVVANNLDERRALTETLHE